MKPIPIDLPVEIDATAVKELMNQPEEILLLDCREINEHETCRIDGAKLIPMNETPDRIDELSAFQDGRIVVYCHAGMRSLQVASWLRTQGFASSQSMIGGIDAWSLHVDPSVPRY